jgi:hypothetical protein
MKWILLMVVLFVVFFPLYALGAFNAIIAIFH